MTEQRARELVATWSARAREAHGARRRRMSFDEYLAEVLAAPERLGRTAVQYTLDALRAWGAREVPGLAGPTPRWRIFDAPFSDGRERLVGQQAAQQALVRILEGFEREGRVNRLIVVHGPNGSAKSSFVTALMRGLEAYSQTDEGALYRFHWVFPVGEGRGSRIGFGDAAVDTSRLSTFAHLPEEAIATRLAAEPHDNPLFLVPEAERRELLTRGRDGGGWQPSAQVLEGALGLRSRQVLDALLLAYDGDLERVLRHVQVERFHVSRRYRQAAATVEPQMHVDAGLRQLTADRSLASLPSALQNRTLFEVHGPLVEGARGIVEFNDFLKRPLEANKYLLVTGEKGSVVVDGVLVTLDSVLVATTNETWLEALKTQPDWGSYRGRVELVRMPYLLDYREERLIYDDLVRELGCGGQVAPHTTELLALWAVMTRLVPPAAAAAPEGVRDVVTRLTPLDKALLYGGGGPPAGLSAEQRQLLLAAVADLAEAASQGPDYEGRHGASPRELRTLLLDAVHGVQGGVVDPPLVFEALEELVSDPSLYEWLRAEPRGPWFRPSAYIDALRERYLRTIEREVQQATGLVDEQAYGELFARYVRHASFWLKKEKLPDPVTGRLVEPDAGFLAEIERRLGVDEAAEVFRSNVIARVAAFRIDHPEASVELGSIFPDLVGRLEAEDARRRRAALDEAAADAFEALEAGEGSPPDALTGERVARARQTVRALGERFGYTAPMARRMLAAHLASRRQGGD